MTAGDNGGFWQWLSEELAQEADQTRDSGGLLPSKPVCLSEVEAVGLLVLACDAQEHGVVAEAAHRLAETLRNHLDHLGTDHDANAMYWQSRE